MHPLAGKQRETPFYMDFKLFHLIYPHKETYIVIPKIESENIPSGKPIIIMVAILEIWELNRERLQSLREKSLDSNPSDRIHTGWWQSKTLIIPTNVDQKSLESEFPIAICRPTGDKLQSKTLFLLTFDPHLSIVKSVFDWRLSGDALLNAPQVSMKPPDQLHRLQLESMSLYLASEDLYCSAGNKYHADQAVIKILSLMSQKCITL